LIEPEKILQQACEGFQVAAQLEMASFVDAIALFWRQADMIDIRAV
jgi:hypothetical protein